jgi:predicted aminopeptidase
MRHTRARLQIVLQARGFAADSIQASHGREASRRTRILERDTLGARRLGARIATASSRTRGGFPSLAECPTRASSTSDAAKDLARDLERRGYDSYVRPSAAFSTLGWFNDPLLSTTLRLDSVDLANTVIHEVTHNTFYKAGQAVFNESFANFVGARGAAWFFRTRRRLRGGRICGCRLGG